MSRWASFRTFAVVALVGLSACREGVAPYEPDGVEVERTGRRTFNGGNDLDPAWMPSGEALLYAADSLLGAPGPFGVLMRMPVDGTTAAVLFPSVHSPATGGPRILAQPSPSPDGERIAFVHIARMHAPRPPAALGPQCLAPEPVLDSAALYIRPAAGGVPVGPPVVGFRIEGRDPRQDSGLPGPYIQTVYPFHALLDEARMFPFRPSWSPDGDRIVFSDGRNLRIHSVGGGTTIVPNTADALSPAWSPAGDVIAFTRVERIDSATYNCSVVGPPGTTQHIRTAYRTRAVLTLARPDGSDIRELGEGWDPAFSADGATIYFRRHDGIWRMPVSGGPAEFVPGTESGRSPAPSPDGALLAFTRWSAASARDIWIVDLSR